MATSSFDKVFTLDNEKAVDSFIKIISTPAQSVKIDKTRIKKFDMKSGKRK